MFQIADVDSGAVRWVNADQVTHIVRQGFRRPTKKPPLSQGVTHVYVCFLGLVCAFPLRRWTLQLCLDCSDGYFSH